MTPNRPYLIGLTGGIATGKSFLAKALMEEGIIVIDADEISRQLTAKGGAALPLIWERFGETVFEGQELNRKALSTAVFNNQSALMDLNALMHPLILAQMERQIETSRAEKALVLDVPLLYETGWDKLCQEVWCAWAPERTQVLRLLERGLTKDEAISRIKSQMPAIKKAVLADRVIITTGEKAANAQAIKRLFQDCQRRNQLV